MRIIAREHLVAFGIEHPGAVSALSRWEAYMKAGSWRTLSEIHTSFPGSKSLGADRMRFQIAGGAFRLIAAFDFGRQAAFIKFIGTHAEYDQVDALTVARY